MKKKFTSFALPFCVIAAALFFINNVHIAAQSLTNKKTNIVLVSDDGQKTTIKFETGAMSQQKVKTPAGEAVIIKADKATPILKSSYPDLPKLTTSIIIPANKNMQVTVVSSSYTDYENVLVAPSKGTITRNIDPSSIPFVYGPAYQENTFWPEKLAELRDPYILRDYRGQAIVVYPFQYNPVTKTLRVYSEITVSVTPGGSGTGINVLTSPQEKLSSEFKNIYANHFLNYDNDLRYEPLEEEGDLLIISYGAFMNAMQPFVDWKIQKGIRTEMVDIATIGNDKTSIKSYVTDYYNTKGLTFLLFVGDDDQVVSSSTGAGDSDNEYGYLSGNDHYQEIFVGRFSAETEEDVTTQVTRTLAYEKTPLIDGYYAQGVGIASNEGPGDDGEMDWEHEENIRTQLVNYNYEEIYELFDGTHSTAANDETGNPSDDDLEALVNSGVGIINYTGHGSTTSISTTGFNNSDVDVLANTEKWPFLWIVGCVTGNFTGNTCFAESWARATHNGLPAGSIANFMSTINQYWDEPMEGQDEMNNILTESELNNVKRTFGGISINGCFSMNDEYGGSGEDMTDTWAIFGDPTLVVRTALPTGMTVTHDPTILLGSTQFLVMCDADNVIAALTSNGEILSTATVSGGMAMLDFDAIANTDPITLTITGYNKIPYIVEIPAEAPTGPYVLGNDFTVVDLAGNNNGLADYNEAITLDAQLENVGISTANNVEAEIESTDPYVTITDATESFGTISNGSVSTKNSAFGITVADNAPDAHVALFTCTASDDMGNSWVTNFSILLNAPVLAVQSFTIDDVMGGNGDGHLDPGETAILTVYNANNGHSDAFNAVGTLTETSAYTEVLTSSYTVGDISVGSNPVASFTVEVAPNAPFGIDVPFIYAAAAGAYTSEYNFVSVVSPAIEDFETNDFTQFEWILSGTVNWFTTSSNPYEGSYCSQSGNINNNQSSTLEITLDVQFDDDISFAKKVSSESGYDFLQFFIDAVKQEEWSGEGDWETVTYPVTEGQHTFKWTFKKDGYFSEGSDCGWIDNVLLPAFEVNTSTAVEPTEATNGSVSAYPNPFSQFTSVKFQINEPGALTMKLYDVTGREVKTLINNEYRAAGIYNIMLDASNLPSGTYFCKVMMGDQTYVQKLILGK